ncbi:MAG TPA: HNH endonuclease signature motif containing protein [Bdellovibrio sp.]
MISKLTNDELDSSLKRLVASERKILHVILQHIIEVNVRKLYLKKAYSSLHEYLVKECHYSGSAAWRRIVAAKLVTEVPAVAEKIQSGSLNLSQISELSRAIKEKERGGAVVSTLQKTEIVAAISGKTTMETQKEISLELDLEIKKPEHKVVQKDDSVRVELTLSQEQYQQLMQCKDLAAHALLSKNGDVSMASVIGFLCENYLKLKKNSESSKKNNVAPNPSTKASFKPTVKSIKAESDSGNLKINKTMTPKTRKEIIKRDICCQFKDARTGKICGSTFALEIDHKKPRWASGGNERWNLQALCRAHNNFKYSTEANLRLLR